MADEKRLIDANSIKYHTERECGGHGIFYDITMALKEDIDALPTVDAVEVVHGRWEPVDHDGSWRVDLCSICHRRMHYVDYDQPYQYCPNCGAKMDGGADNGG